MECTNQLYLRGLITQAVAVPFRYSKDLAVSGPSANISFPSHLNTPPKTTKAPEKNREL
jgi:hypothetical protein